MKYRIVKLASGDFAIQKKILWYWVFVKRLISGPFEIYESLVLFDTPYEAEQWLFPCREEEVKWNTVEEVVKEVRKGLWGKRKW